MRQNEENVSMNLGLTPPSLRLCKLVENIVLLVVVVLEERGRESENVEEILATQI